MKVRLYKFIGLFIGSVGLLIVLGWLADIRVLKSIIPGQSVVPSNCAITWALVGWSLFFVSTNNKWLRNLGRLLAVCVMVTGVATLAGSMHLISDDWISFQPREDSIPIVFPGQMLAQESVPFILIGTSLLILPLQSMCARITSRVLVVGAMLPAMQAVLGYVLSNPDLFTFCTPGECARLHLALALITLLFGLTVFFCTRNGKHLKTAAS